MIVAIGDVDRLNSLLERILDVRPGMASAFHRATRVSARGCQP